MIKMKKLQLDHSDWKKSFNKIEISDKTWNAFAIAGCVSYLYHIGCGVLYVALWKSK